METVGRHRRDTLETDLCLFLLSRDVREGREVCEGIKVTQPNNFILVFLGVPGVS
jgi:hypothetical protein